MPNCGYWTIVQLTVFKVLFSFGSWNGFCTCHTGLTSALDDITRYAQFKGKKNLLNCHCNWTWQLDISKDILVDLETGSWFVVWINLCVLPSVFIGACLLTFLPKWSPLKCNKDGNLSSNAILWISHTPLPRDSQLTWTLQDASPSHKGFLSFQTTTSPPPHTPFG